MNHRKAKCACGQLTLTVEGDPLRILTCHCDYCQRRTGAPFQVSCWYEKDKVEIVLGTKRNKTEVGIVLGT